MAALAGPAAADALASVAGRARLTAWLCARGAPWPAAPGALEVERPAGGWSNETAILRLGGRRFVLRLAPARLAMFPDYDLGREAALLAALGPLRRPPVPALLGQEADPAVLGRPFFVMAFVPGLVPPDSRPGYAEAGWLAEADAASQRLFWDDMVDCIAQLHAVDWRACGLAAMSPPQGAAPAAALDWLARLHAWSAAPQPQVEAALALLARTLPAESGPDCLLWGDARPANVIVQDFRIAALLDWELAGTGPVELDLAWLLEMHWLRTEGAGVQAPAGFPDEAAILARYVRTSGRRLRPLPWYRLYSAAKVAVLMHRHLVVAVDRGMLRARHPLLRENVATRRLAVLIGNWTGGENDDISG